MISTLGDLGYLEGTAAAAVAAADEPELAAGVVAARPSAPPTSFADVELGTAGAAPAPVVDELPVTTSSGHRRWRRPPAERGAGHRWPRAGSVG